jgi:hypothetical protein
MTTPFRLTYLLSKTCLILIVIGISILSLQAQKTLDFANIANGVNAPITNSSGQRISAPGPFVADLFYSTNTNSVPNPLGSDSFLAGGFNQAFSSAGAGYFLGGTRSIANATNVVVQVRVWDTTYGSTYTAARNAGGQFGYSGYFVITLASPPSTPTLLRSLKGFKLTTIHSPSQGADDYGGAEPPPVVVVTEPEGSVGSGPDGLLSAEYGCGLSLVGTRSNTTAILTLQNAISGHTYSIWSETNISLTNWTLETNFVANQSSMKVGIAIGQRTNLYFRAGESRQYLAITNSSFKGLASSDMAGTAEPPDTMGAVGQDHFVEILNGGIIAVYNKNGGQLVESNSIYDFFSVGGTNPAPILTDPRIIYDSVSNRWVATMIDYNSSASYNLILAVSKTNTPVGLLSNWSKCWITVAKPNTDSDFDTLGMDMNGIYISVVHRGGVAQTNAGFTVVALRKQDVYTGITNRFVVLTNHPGLTSWCIQPAVNFDNVAADGYAWFVAKGPPEWGTRSGTNYYFGGAVLYRRLQWSGTNAVWADATWVTNQTSLQRDYYDFDGADDVTIHNPGIGAPQLGGTGRIALGDIGSRLLTAVIRNGSLWTCQHVGLSITSGIYVGDQTGATVNRSAVQWIRYTIDPIYGGFSYGSHGRIFDAAASNPFWYHFPSLSVNCAGDTVVGFSGSSAANYVGVYYSWILGGNVSAATPLAIRQGTVYYTTDRWGDYSQTSVDPSDGLSFWTVQEFADSQQPPGYVPWATWITKLSRSP